MVHVILLQLIFEKKVDAVLNFIASKHQIHVNENILKQCVLAASFSQIKSILPSLSQPELTTVCFTAFSNAQDPDLGFKLLDCVTDSQDFGTIYHYILLNFLSDDMSALRQKALIYLSTKMEILTPSVFCKLFSVLAIYNNELPDFLFLELAEFCINLIKKKNLSDNSENISNYDLKRIVYRLNELDNQKLAIVYIHTFLPEEKWIDEIVMRPCIEASGSRMIASFIKSYDSELLVEFEEKNFRYFEKIYSTSDTFMIPEMIASGMSYENIVHLIEKLPYEKKIMAYPVLRNSLDVMFFDILLQVYDQDTISLFTENPGLLASLFLDWSATGSRDGKFFNNIQAVLDLERAYPGSVVTLHASSFFNISNFTRYPQEILGEMFLLLKNSKTSKENKSTKSTTRFGVVLLAKADHNSALNQNKEIYENLQKQLDQYGIQVLFVEAGTKLGALKRIKTVNKLFGSGTRGIEFMMISAHGSHNSFQLAENKEKIRISDFMSMTIKQQESFKKMYAENMPWLLNSCSTGVEGGIAESISRRFLGRAAGPVLPTALKDIHVIFDENGVIQMLSPVYYDYQSREPVQTQVFKNGNITERYHTKNL